MRRQSGDRWTLLGPRTLALAILGLALAAIAAMAVGQWDPVMAGPGPAGVLQTRTLVVGAEERSYLLYLPATYTGASATPLVVVNHGSNVRVDGILRVGFNQQADSGGFLVAYPQLETDIPADVEFVLNLVTALQTELNVDNRRISIAGISRGGAVTYLASCDPRIAAIAAVGSAAGPGYTCGPDKRLSIIHIHGTNDGAAPYAATGPIMAYWREQNQCSAPRSVVVAPTVTRESAPCPNGRVVTLYTIDGGVHSWPGVPLRPGELRMAANEEEPASLAIDATLLIWRFFRDHPLA
jgi:polyhydroxybutyrate depolymerase